jgi:hypothetical protein
MNRRRSDHDHLNAADAAQGAPRYTASTAHAGPPRQAPAPRTLNRASGIVQGVAVFAAITGTSMLVPDQRCIDRSPQIVDLERLETARPCRFSDVATSALSASVGVASAATSLGGFDRVWHGF